MKLTITIQMDNAAFEDSNAGPEVARILRNLADDMDEGGSLTSPGAHATLRDINGNTVGKAKVSR